MRICSPFYALPSLDHAALPWRFRAANGYLVEILTPVRKRGEKSPLALPRLEASAIALQYLSWLIENALPAAMPFGSGIAVTIPRPERYAVHKLILSQIREQDQVKSQKDLAQARALIEALEAVRPGRVADAIEDATTQGNIGWKHPLKRAAQALYPDGSWKTLDPYQALL